VSKTSCASKRPPDPYLPSRVCLSAGRLYAILSFEMAIWDSPLRGGAEFGLLAVAPDLANHC